MIVAVIGSRGIEAGAYSIICDEMPEECSEIVSGGADGTDLLAERYAAEHGCVLTVFKPHYDKLGHDAPLSRNREIVAYADYVLALWDGMSNGTRYTVGFAEAIGKPYRVVRVYGKNDVRRQRK